MNSTNRDSVGNLPPARPGEARRIRLFWPLVSLLGLTVLLIGAFIWPFNLTSAGFRLFGKPRPRQTNLSAAESLLLGHWRTQATIGNLGFELSRDGTFHGHAGACLWHGESRGTWRREGDRLVLSTESSFSQSHSWPGPDLWGPVSRTEEYEVVTWGPQLLLVEPDDMERFVDDINNGQERGQGARRSRLTRERFGTRAPPGLPDLSEPWKSRLFPGEIRGSILVVQGKRGKADVGRKHGVRDGVTFMVEGGGTRWESAALRVVKVTDSESEFEITRDDPKRPVAPGQVFSSWFIQPGADGWPDYR